MKIHFIVHESFEAPGAYQRWADKRGYHSSFTRLYAGDSLPLSSQGYDCLIVMGGPQSPRTKPEECSYFHADEEIALIQDFIQADKPVVGICLGSQLLGEAFGAPVEASPYREIGHFPIRLTDKGRQDDKLRHFPDELVVGHWHADMPGLTADSEVLASSQGCPRQIVKYSEKHYAFQCHLEFSRELISPLVEAETNFATYLQELPYIQDEQTMLDYDYREMNIALEQFLDALMQQT